MASRQEVREFQEKLRSISFAPSAMPSRAPGAVLDGGRESRWEKDIPAYRRLRKDGLQPKKVDGCAAVEQKAESRVDVEGVA